MICRYTVSGLPANISLLAIACSAVMPTSASAGRAPARGPVRQMRGAISGGMRPGRNLEYCGACFRTC